MFPKTSAYVKSYDGEMMNYGKNIMIFRTKLVIVLKNNLIAKPSTQ